MFPPARGDASISGEEGVAKKLNSKVRLEHRTPACTAPCGDALASRVYSA